MQGYCLGGHNHMAYCCDFTIAADNAIFGQAGPARCRARPTASFVPYLTKVVGAKRRGRCGCCAAGIPALKNALQMGLVNKVVPLERLEDEVEQWCEELLSP